MRSGFGIYESKEEVYEGSWREGVEDGEGKLVVKGRFEYSDKRVYEGYWHHNNKFGMGTVFFPNGVKFHGLFQKGCNTEGIFSRVVKKEVSKEVGCLENYNWGEDKLNKNL